MEASAKKLDFLTKHWAPYRRRFPSVFPVATAAHAWRKNAWVHTAFDTCNFSLILRGRGEFRRFGQVWPVQAPCVITQWPGERLDYGPDLPHFTWDELYIVYDRSFFRPLQEVHLIDLKRPVWPIADPAAVEAQVEELTRLARHPEPESVVDRVDRVCERLVLETWLAPNPDSTADNAIHAIAAELRRRPGEPANLDALASEHGFSPTTFRRRWQATMGMPPARYLQGLRMREACRLLVETTLPVHEVASAVGFEDEFYFSRRFHLEQGQAPRDYRKTFRLRR
jgi:AraC-like DNA-binding protein